MFLFSFKKTCSSIDFFLWWRGPAVIKPYMKKIHSTSAWEGGTLTRSPVSENADLHISVQSIVLLPLCISFRDCNLCLRSLQILKFLFCFCTNQYFYFYFDFSFPLMKMSLFVLRYWESVVLYPWWRTAFNVLRHIQHVPTQCKLAASFVIHVFCFSVTTKI